MSAEAKKIAWLDWYAHTMKLALAALVVFGTYALLDERAEEHANLCDLARTYVEEMDTSTLAARQEYRQAEKTVRSACDFDHYAAE